VARNECLRRLGTTTRTAHRDEVDPADQRADATQLPTEAAERLTSINGGPEQADLPTFVRSILAELKPPEREVIELILGHDLYGSDLATALGVSWSRAHAQAVRARGRLEKALRIRGLHPVGGPGVPRELRVEQQVTASSRPISPGLLVIMLRRNTTERSE
jgi:DNA-directed RNA polymerase specialized sigma24 family protein